ncbi:MAG: M14 family metallopeptidase [Desulfoprunum sp.]|nr:M14 family metallopeptidase [Desulfoprunum sp.]
MKYCYRLVFFLLSFFVGGCSTSLNNFKTHFYDYQHVTTALDSLTEKRASLVDVYSIGQSHEGRKITAIKITKKSNPARNKPGILALFAEHAGEHETTSLAMGIVQYLVDNGQINDRISSLLEKTELWIVPMMNPDGVDYDLSGAPEPFSWRKNRRPTETATYGVDLNRNWGYHLEIKPPEKIEKCYSRKDSPNYAGDKPFSEPETQAVRDLLLAHQNIKILLDYHSGSAGFMQGAVGCATGRGTRKGIHPSIDAFCNGFIDSFAERVTDPHDTRPGFLVMSNEGAADIMRQRVPFYIKPFVPSKFFEEPGTSINYTYDQLNMAAIGIELFRGSSFFKNLPGSQRILIENQVRGILLLLDIIAKKYGYLDAT